MIKIIFLEKVDSTNNSVKAMPTVEQIHGTSVVAAVQSAGRGRLGKQWHSKSPGGLYCSIIIQPEVAVEHLPQITLVTGVAVAEALETFCEITIGLKWPNDLFCDGKKIAGILVETLGNSENTAPQKVVVGIGVNVLQEADEFDESIADMATSIKIKTGNALIIKDLFKAISSHLLDKISLFEKNGFGCLLSEWRSRDVLAGKTVTMVNYKREIVHGVAEGINEKGVLKVRDIDGKLHEVLSGDVQLAKKKQP